MVEARVEARFVKEVEKRGGKTVKIKDKKDWPDRIVLFSNNMMAFVELKRPGQKPRAGQIRNHNMLRSMGYAVLVFDGTDWDRVELWLALMQEHAQP